jgi:hypothetical protein
VIYFQSVCTLWGLPEWALPNCPNLGLGLPRHLDSAIDWALALNWATKVDGRCGFHSHWQLRYQGFPLVSCWDIKSDQTCFTDKTVIAHWISLPRMYGMIYFCQCWVFSLRDYLFELQCIPSINNSFQLIQLLFELYMAWYRSFFFFLNFFMLSANYFQLYP